MVEDPITNTEVSFALGLAAVVLAALLALGMWTPAKDLGEWDPKHRAEMMAPSAPTETVGADG